MRGSGRIMDSRILLIALLLVLIAPSVAWAERWAVLVGLDRYNDPTINEISGAVNDAERLDAALREQLDVPEENILVYVSGASEPDRVPKIGNLVRGFKYIASKAAPGDEFILFFAGHGMHRGGESYLMTWYTQRDALEETAFSLKDLRKHLVKIRASKKLVLLDACRDDPEKARGAADNPMDEGFALGIRGIAVEERAVRGSDAVTVVLTASSPGQRAYEVPGEKRGFFSFFVEKGLSGAAADDKGRVTIQSLITYLDRTVPDAVKRRTGRDQTPAVLSMNGPDPGAWVLATRKVDIKQRALELKRKLEQHAAQVERDWRSVEDLVRQAGAVPALRPVVEEFLAKYRNDPLGNPRDADAKRLLDELGRTVAAAVEGYVRIEPGCFQMGSPADEPERDNDEKRHRVCISRAFYLKSTEVTQKEWRDVMGNSPSRFKHCGDDCPVETVNWYEALAFCNALSRSEGLSECYTLSGCGGKKPGQDMECKEARFKGLSCSGYRLPTEAEWEYAARAGTGTAIYTGSMEIKGLHNAPALDPIAWYGGNSGVDYEGGFDCSDWSEKQRSSSRCGTHRVAGKLANGWGLHDMLGNVWEWCWDWHGAYGGNANDPLGASTGSFRVIRGGSWYNIYFTGYVRAANRFGSAPGRGRYFLGFRPARSIP